MFMAIIVGDLKVGMFFSGNYSQQERAYWASMSGLAYAEHMINLNADWKGNSTAIPIDDQDIFIEEQYSAQPCTVHGVINSGESEFYIAFARLDSGNKIIPVKDQAGNFLTYYSYNNLSKQSASTVSIDCGGTKREMPAGSLYVAVEGRSERARSYVEALYLVNYSISLPSVAISSGNMDVELKDADSKLLITDSAGDNPMIKSNNSITVNDTSSNKKILDLASGKAYAKQKIKINGMDVTRDNQADFGLNAELNVDSSSSFPKLSWDQVIKNRGDPDSESSKYEAQIDAGTYAFIESRDTPGTYNLNYFPQNYAKEFIPPKEGGESFSTHMSGITVPLNGQNLAPTSLELSTSTETSIKEIKPEHGDPISSFSLAAYDWDSGARSYTPSSAGKAKFLLHKNSTEGKETSLCSNGDIHVKGELSGSGSVISGSTIDFEPKSQLVPDAEVGLALYSKGDISVHYMSMNDSVNDPTSYVNQALTNYVSTYGQYFTNMYSASRRILDTYISVGGSYTTLDSVLEYSYGFSSWEARALVTKLLTKNTEREGYQYKIIPPSSPDYDGLDAGDSLIKGVIYTWGNFNADVHGGSITLRGAVVAYGGNPGSQKPGENKDSGKVAISNGKFVNIIYDPNYLGILGVDGLGVGIRRVMFNRMN